MPQLEYELIKELIEHGSKAPQGSTVDPSTNEVLREAGVPKLATYIEQLSLVGLTVHAAPIIGNAGGFWIGYELSERARELARDEQALRLAVGSLTGGPQDRTSSEIAALRTECAAADINVNYRDEFLETLDEIRICFDEKCFIAAIALCGKILEVCLKEVLLRHDITVEPRAMLGELIRLVRDQVPTEYFDPALVQIAQIINTSRITAVHAQERVPIPSKDQAAMVVYAICDVVRRNLTHAG